MEHVQHDKEQEKQVRDAWTDEQPVPLTVTGPVVHNDHAYELFIAGRQGGYAYPKARPEVPGHR